MVFGSTAAPSKIILPRMSASLGSAPTMARASSLFPAPITPATPTTLPLPSAEHALGGELLKLNNISHVRSFRAFPDRVRADGLARHAFHKRLHVEITNGEAFAIDRIGAVVILQLVHAQPVEIERALLAMQLEAE